MNELKSNGLIPSHLQLLPAKIAKNIIQRSGEYMQMHSLENKPRVTVFWLWNSNGSVVVNVL